MRRLALAASLLGPPAAGQETPRVLFPDAPLPAAPVQPVVPVRPEAPINVQDLPTPTVLTAGLPAMEAELAGPLWARGAPPALAELLRQLPTRIDEPTLRELQRALLAAPGPADVAADALLGLRADRLLAMGEAATALELLALAPTAPSPELDTLRLRARMATGETGPVCESLPAAAERAATWLRAAVVCAALAGNATAVEIALDRVAAADSGADQNLAGLARAAIAGSRYPLHTSPSDEAILLPLLRKVPIDLDTAIIPSLSVPVRQALADNPGLASAARAAVVASGRPGPSIRPELNGVAPGDWAAAMAGVPPEQRARWAALVDGLGMALPDGVWNGLASAEGADPGPAPSLRLWRGFELASLNEQRGAMLLHVLLLLDGRPEAAAPVTLRRALDALLALGLERDARALAAGTGGALGL